MTRVKRSVHAKKKRRATLALTRGFRGEANSSYKRAKEALMKADSYAYRDRRNRKRDFRRLWITRINAAARLNGLSYSQFMHGLSTAGVEVDRKMLADLAVHDAEAFRRFPDVAREAPTASPPCPPRRRGGPAFCPSPPPSRGRLNARPGRPPPPNGLQPAGAASNRNG